MLKKLISERERTIFLRVAGGALVRSANNEFYSTVAGRLEEIFVDEFVVNEKKRKTWHVKLSDGNDVYEVVFPLRSASFKHLIRCLSSPEGMSSLSDVAIRAYLSKKQYTNVSVYGCRHLLCYRKGPEIGMRNVGSGNYVDQEMCRLQDLVDSINSHVRSERDLMAEREWS